MTDTESFDETFPYRSATLDTDDGALRFVDEGPREGHAVVLVHGNPSWGYLYRKFVSALVAEGYRVIVPDHLGFGRSDKPTDAAALSVERHAARFSALMSHLDLRGVCLVVHDWGGPIALRWATDYPERVSMLVLMNTFVHRPTGPVSIPTGLRLARLPALGALLVKRLNVVVRGFLLGDGVHQKQRWTPAARRAYLSAHRSASERAGILALARAYPDGPDGDTARLHGQIEAGLSKLASRPVWIVWGLRDSVLGADVLARWSETFPHAARTTLEDAGHFVQEDAHEVLVPMLVERLRIGR